MISKLMAWIMCIIGLIAFSFTFWWGMIKPSWVLMVISMIFIIIYVGAIVILLIDYFQTR